MAGLLRPTAMDKAAIAAAVEGVLPSIVSACDKLVGSSQSMPAKYKRLINISKVVTDKIAPFTPCAQQCSFCCHMAVSIFEYEARRIARYIDRCYVKQVRLTRLEDIQKAHARWIKGYTRVPCTFLKEGKCSIYPMRPLACRLHHTISDDNRCCDLTFEQVTPAVDLGLLEKTQVMVFRDQAFGDIRDYFPAA